MFGSVHCDFADGFGAQAEEVNPPMQERDLGLGRITLYVSTTTIVFTALSLTALLAVAAANPPGLVGREFSPQEVDTMIQGYQDQVSLMLQLGAPMVGGLAAAVMFLIHALLRGHRVLVNEVRAGAEERVKLFDSITELIEELHQRKCLLPEKHRKEFSQ